MHINKLQRSRLIFDLPAKVAHIVVPSVYQNIVFSETTRPIELKFHMKTPFDMLAKIYSNCSSHMTKFGQNKICLNNKPKLTATYFKIIKEIK